MDRHTIIETVTSTPAKLTPAAVGTGYALANLPWSQIAAALTVFYTLLLIGDWFYKKYKEHRTRVRAREYFRKLRGKRNGKQR